MPQATSQKITFKQKIAPCLWFDNQGEEAAKLYVSIFKNSGIDHIARYGKEAAARTPPLRRMNASRLTSAAARAVARICSRSRPLAPRRPSGARWPAGSAADGSGSSSASTRPARRDSLWA